MAKMQYTKLGETDMNVSKISIGGASFGDIYGNFDQKKVDTIVEYAYEKGINFYDTAYWYGQGTSEERLGKALQNIPRSSYYIATKVGRYENSLDKMFDFRAEKTIQAVDACLQRLQLPYVDLIQVHDLEFASNEDIILNETLPALQKVCDSGKARYIGITGYPLSYLVSILEKSRVKIHTVISHSHATLQDDELKDYVPIFEKYGLGIINASALSMGLLTPQGPQPWHVAPQSIKEACKNAAEYCESNGFSITRLARYFSINFPGVCTTLLGVDTIDNISECLDLKLTEAETSFLETLRDKFFKDVVPKNWEKEEFELKRKVLEASNR